MTPRSRLDFERIDRRLAFTFLAFAAGLVAAVVVVGAMLYTEVLRGEQQRFASVIAGVLKPGLESARGAGSFRLQRLASRLQENPAIVYVRIVDAEGLVVQEGPVPLDAAAGDVSARASHGVTVRTARVEGATVTEIVDRLHGGYQDSWLGFVRIGVHRESLSRSAARAVGLLGLLLLALLAASWPLIRWYSRRLGAPVQTLARDFAGVMEHAPLHVAIEDAQGAIDRASVTFQRAFDVRPSETPRTRALLPPGALDDLGAHPEVKVVLRGEERTLHLARFPVLLGPEGQVLRSALVGTDVTAWRRDQAERDRLAAAVESTADALLVVEPGRGVVYGNPALFRLTGFTREEVLDHDPAQFLPADEAGRATLAAVGGEAVWGGVLAARRRDGPPWQCDLLISPIGPAGGEVRSQVWVARDVSRETELEAQLRQSQKMEAVGLLAGGIAHDFNNLLTVVLSAAELLQLDELSSDQRQNVTTIAEAGQRAADLTRQLLAFSRRQLLVTRPLALNEVIGGALSLLRRGIGPTVELEFVPGPELWTMRGDAGQLEQVLMNLALNARDAMPGGGHLLVASANLTLSGAGAAADGTPVPDGDYVALTVTDTGGGILPDDLERIFEPFFSTKAPGKGTGLGLATVLGIVKQSGGFIWATSTPGRGTSFQLAFPRIEPAPTDAVTPTPVPATAKPGHGEHILVVEDEPAVRSVVEAMLTRAGFRVTTAENGEVALAKLAASPALPDLVLSDVMMPKMGGYELARAVAQRHPGLPLLFLSGYTEPTPQAEGLEAIETVWKPPGRADLLAAVERGLERGRAARAKA